MSTRKALQIVTSTSEPSGLGVGDQWFNPATNILNVRVALNGNAVGWYSVTQVGGPSAGALPFYLNSTTITSNYTIPTNFNAMTAGPVTINDNITVTVPDGSTWTVV
jgi:hypothetical protein